MPDPQPVTDIQKRTPCNLVMKGAIVSGVVYPSVITQLKDYHDFHNIGGTSAGAIAAAAAAAAEYRRQKAIAEGDVAHQDDGFNYMQDQLSSTLGKQGFLFSLFPRDAQRDDSKQTENERNVLSS
jgi:predicted acylesterase/phospholipase RssA